MPEPLSVLITDLVTTRRSHAVLAAGTRYAVAVPWRPTRPADQRGQARSLPASAQHDPGFDVHAAAAAGLAHCAFETYTDLAGHPVYGRRMREHAVRGFVGRLCAEYPF
ncbi:hypothetical protein ACW9HJ_14910 [Nocardia gipuzkoensis]